MGLGKLEKEITKLPASDCSPLDVARLRKKAGKTVDAAERARLRELLRDEGDRFNASGRAALVGTDGTIAEPRFGEIERYFSDVTVDPQTGAVFLLSDCSERVYEMMLEVAGGVETMRAVDGWTLPPLEGKRRLQPEGLAFDHRGDLWVVSEGDRSLLRRPRRRWFTAAASADNRPPRRPRHRSSGSHWPRRPTRPNPRLSTHRCAVDVPRVRLARWSVSS